MTTPVLCVLVNTLQYYDTVDFVQDSETEDPHKHKEKKMERERERDHMQMMPSVHKRMSRELSVSLNHKKHTVAAKHCLNRKTDAFSLVDSGPSTQTFSRAQKHTNKRPPFQTLVTIPTTALTHLSW